LSSPDFSFEEVFAMYVCDPDLSAATIGGVIRYRRRDLRMTQRELSKLSGVDRKAIGKIEQGKTCPRLDTVERLAYVLGRKLCLSPAGALRVAE
jgi:DNA-binding XRE family transcriptional regulator